MNPAILLDELRRETESMVSETERLVRIDSPTGDPVAIRSVSAAVGKLLASAGLAVSARPDGGLSARLETGVGPRMLLLGHADTVWPAGTAARWPPRRRDGQLSGPGVGDMKGCLVMAAHAIAAARRAGLDELGTIELLIVADEEHGSVASRKWIESRARAADACLGLEAGWPGGGIVVGRGAVGAMRAIAHGKAAHAAGHEDQGASAIAALAPLVSEFEALSRPAEGVLLTVGVFCGGVARQVVPDHAELLLDLRAPDAEAADALLEQVHAIVDAAAGGEVTVELEGGVTRPTFARQVSEPLWQIASRLARTLRLPLHPVFSRGGADASFAAALGVPTLDGLGPICHDSCARGERIEIGSIAERAALLACLIVELAGRGATNA